MTMTVGSIRVRLLKQAVAEQLEQFSAALSDPSLASVRITVNLRADGAPRSVVIEPQLRVECAIERHNLRDSS